MSTSYERQAAPGYRDLVPWADPYIASLMEKLRRSEAQEEEARRELRSAGHVSRTQPQGNSWNANNARHWRF